jgi:hypothetical protein
MSIFLGHRPADNFSISPNAWFRDPRLSAKAKGILGYINSHAAGYELTMEQMIAEMADGKASLYAGLKELEDAGYLARYRRRDPQTGRLSSVDFYLGEPIEAECPVTENRNVEPTSGNAASSQVAPTFRFSTSGKSATKKTTSIEDKVLEDEKETTGSFVAVRASAQTPPLDQDSTVDDIEQALGKLDASEAGRAQGMLEQGKHPRFVYNTLKRQREAAW